MLRIVVNPHAPEAATIARAAEVIRAGGIVAIPTDTLYGLAADPFSPDAVARVFAAKGRDATRALPLIAWSAEQIETHIGPFTPNTALLSALFWPGPLTLIVPAPRTLADDVTVGAPTVAVRVPAHAVARELCLAAGTLLTATSANRSGAPPSDDPDVVEASIGHAVEMLLDGGKSPGGPPSTIVDMTTTPPELRRTGAVPWEDVLRCLQLA
jgi:L-threonylcarbamoyladenylate synthase